MYVGSLSINSKYRELQKLLKIYNIDLDNCFVYYEVRNEEEKSVRLSEENIYLSFTKPIKCIIDNKEYISNTWKHLLHSIVIDLNNINANLFNQYAKTAFWCTETKRWSDSKYYEELGIYLSSFNADNTYKELRKL